MITTIKSDRKKAVTIGIYIILLTIVSTTHTLAQHFQLNGNNAGNTLFQSAPKVGLGTTNPNAYFHISNNLNDYPIFKIDGH